MPKQFTIEMSDSYPFGQLGETLTEDTKAHVIKTLHFSSEDQYDMIKQMVHFLKSAKHENLINIEKVLQSEDAIQLYYEYAPFRLEKWLVEINQDLINSLQEQLMELADYLTRSSIRFEFDPNNIGLSKDMTIKYFLNQFSIDVENHEETLKELQSEIKMFFKQLCGSVSEKSQKDESEGSNCRRFQSLSTNASMSPMDDLVSLTKSVGAIRSKYVYVQSTNKAKNTQLSEKVQNSKKKSLEILERLKKMNQK